MRSRGGRDGSTSDPKRVRLSLVNRIGCVHRYAVLMSSFLARLGYRVDRDNPAGRATAADGSTVVIDEMTGLRFCGVHGTRKPG